MTKKIISIILSLMLILSMFSVSAFAADTLADAKQAAISELEAALETALCDEAKAYYNDGIPEINNAESIEAVNAIMKICIRGGADRDSLFVFVKAQAIGDFEAVITDGSTNEIKELVAAAKDAVNSATSIETLAMVANYYTGLINDNLDAEEAARILARVKTEYAEAVQDYLDALEAMRLDYDSTAVKQLIDNAESAFSVASYDEWSALSSNLGYLEEIFTSIKNQVADQREADAKELAMNIEAAKGEVDIMYGADTSANVAALVAQEKSAIEAAHTVSEILDIMYDYNELIVAAQYDNAHLDEIKEAAIKELTEFLDEIEEYDNADANNIVITAIAAVDDCADAGAVKAVVKSAKENAMAAIELAEAKADAEKEILAAVPADAPSGVAEAANGAVAALAELKTVDEVNTAVVNAKALIDEKYAQALADAKVNAEALINDAAGEEPSDEVLALAEAGKKAVNEASSIDAVNGAKDTAIADINAQLEKEAGSDTPDDPDAPDTPDAPEELEKCNNRVSGFCDVYNRYIEVPVLNVILSVIHAILHVIIGW